MHTQRLTKPGAANKLAIPFENCKIGDANEINFVAKLCLKPLAKGLTLLSAYCDQAIITQLSSGSAVVAIHA
ncbi:hypothetical protein U5922_014395 [Aquicoccus sp. G2-2]|uniref:hypothetical protein n=1 Tax=Aquicoccus sp. G2-2 TaxID=3092120 RepID=UPI002ADFB780|nr:hypothetical protein [Aquicoccus sp. G2-2]MEA1114588.1 hypothetical protein [Aquicoccus sp. G2-2]